MKFCKPAETWNLKKGFFPSEENLFVPLLLTVNYIHLPFRGRESGILGTHISWKDCALDEDDTYPLANLTAKGIRDCSVTYTLQCRWAQIIENFFVKKALDNKTEYLLSSQFLYHIQVRNIFDNFIIFLFKFICRSLLGDDTSSTGTCNMSCYCYR